MFRDSDRENKQLETFVQMLSTKCVLSTIRVVYTNHVNTTDNKAARIRRSPEWMFRLPFKIYGAVMTYKN